MHTAHFTMCSLYNVHIVVLVNFDCMVFINICCVHGHKNSPYIFMHQQYRDFVTNPNVFCSSWLNLLVALHCGFMLQHRYLSFGSFVYTDLCWKTMISAGEKQFCINKNNFLPLLHSSGVSKHR